jgi:LmbE family N-acetylglucosaminyl deacetylase
MTPEETVARRAKESAEVAAYLGVSYDVWDIEDCRLVADLPTRERLIRYIRSISPDLIITHRPSDYHADHRAAAQLVQDASYLLVVPHACPDVPAMRRMPVIMYNEDSFRNPAFYSSYVIDIDDAIDAKLHIAHLNQSQVYEWLPYTYEETVPDGAEERFAWLKGMEITRDTTDEEILAAPRGWAVRFAKTAARFRRELIARYGTERGSKVRFAEAFELCEYGAKPTPEMEKELFNF